MRILSSFFILLFVSFQFSTSIIYFVDNCNEKNVAIYNQEEEEEQEQESSKEQKELKSFFIENTDDYLALISKIKSSKIETLYLISEYKVLSTITILPPEQV